MGKYNWNHKRDLTPYGSELKKFLGIETYNKWKINRSKQINHRLSGYNGYSTTRKEYVIDAFSWTDTPEGTNFWLEVHEKWQHGINNGEI